jgi:RNA polymerase sigma-70 factor (ECF subfamily)
MAGWAGARRADGRRLESGRSEGVVSTPSDETAWVVRAQCGDREALELLLRSVQPRLQRYLSRLVGAGHAADVVQEVLISIARKLPWLADPRLLRPWAFRIASRAAFRHLRREKRWLRIASEEADFDTIPAQDPPPSDDLLRELLESDELSPASRAVLVLHFQEEMPLAGVAAVLEIPLGTAKSRLAYGLTALRRHLGNRRSI